MQRMPPATPHLFVVAHVAAALLLTTPSPALATCPHPLCSYSECLPNIRPTAPAANALSADLTFYRPKDFCVIKVGNVFHSFFILQSTLGPADSSTTRLGHSISFDLVNWFKLDPAIPVRSGKWDSAHIWAPSIVVRDSFFMFYTGVSASGKQSIGLATSTNLADWHRRDTPVFSCENAPWSYCDSTNATYGQDFRDPFVMADPDSAGRWLMYYATRLGDSAAVPGLAISSDLMAWRDRGPLWRRPLNGVKSPVFESPHVFGHQNKWFLAFTTNAGLPLEFQVGDSPTDTSSNWFYYDRISNLDCIDGSGFVGSECFYDPLSGGSGQTYFANYTGSVIQFRQMRWWGGDSTYFSLQTPVEIVPPADVSDLAVTFGKTTAVLSWTAPGDDSITGTAAEYDLRYSSSPITALSFSSATRITTSSPNEAGTEECAEISDLSSCTGYYFALRTMDADSNSSAISNIVGGETNCDGNVEYSCSFRPNSQNAQRRIRPEQTGVSKIGAVPNPFSEMTAIGFAMPVASRVVVDVFDPTGRRVLSHDCGRLSAGFHSFAWDRQTSDGGRASAGLYLVRVIAGSRESTHKLIALP